MKRFKICKVSLLFFICIFCFNFRNMQVGAADKQNIIVWNESYEYGGIKEFSFHVSGIGRLFVDLDETMAYDDYSVCLKDGTGNILYVRQFDWLDDEDCSFTIELSEGDYIIVFSTEGEAEFSVQAYFEYEPSIEHPAFTLSKKLLELYVGESKVLRIESNPAGVSFDVEWSSSKPSVAEVNQDGTVVAKKTGSAIIKAVVNGVVYKCEVSVEKKLPTYKEVVAKVKKYQTKYIKFQQIDVGYQSRLYNLGYWGSRYYKNRGYGILVEDESYIEIKKKGNTATLSLIISGTHRFFATKPMYANYTKMKLYTQNRKITYDYTSHSENTKYNYKYHTYTTTLKWKSKISSDSKVSLEKLNKLLRMFEHKNVALKTLTNDSSGNTCGQLPELTRKNWLKIFKTYKKLLVLYE